MINYQNFEVEDFLHDDFFIESVLQPNNDSDLFWQEWLLNFPGKKGIFENARIIVLSIGIQPIQHELSEAEVHDIVNHVQNAGYQSLVITCS